MKILAIWVFPLIFLFSVVAIPQEKMHLENELPIQAENGQIQLTWKAGQAPYTLSAEYSDRSEKVTLYSGDFTSYFMSGIPEGEHRFYLKDSTDTFIEFNIHANYPSDLQVKIFLILGLLLFALLTTIVTKGVLKRGRKTT